MEKVAGWIARVMREGEAAVPGVKEEVIALMKNYPLYV
jgi:glycine hydroxymethyltransferase